jgi:exopolysaccharide biosynthesis polyprenyl glycosylphosphotransferase
MFHSQYRTYSRLLLAADALVPLAALYISYRVRSSIVPFLPAQWASRFNPELLPFRDYLFYFLVLAPCWIWLLWVTERYPEVMRLPLRRQLTRLLHFVPVVGFLIGFLSYTFKLEVSRPVVLGFLTLLTGFMGVNRLLSYWALRGRKVADEDRVRILLVGAAERVRAVARSLEEFRAWGYHLTGYLSFHPGGAGPADLQRLGSPRDLPALLTDEAAVVHEVLFVGSDARELEDFEDLIRLCEDLGVRTRVAVDFFPTSIARMSIEYLEQLPLLTLSTVPDHSLEIVAKRFADVLIASLLSVTFAPLMVLVAAAVKLTSRGPVLYRQERCGLYGRRFTLVKFRTMEVGAEDKLWDITEPSEAKPVRFKPHHDPRVTVLGRFLRRSSLDELPQFWNVIKGEMSLVGPRPPLPEEVKYYSIKQRRRLSVKPGITCVWQVSGRSNVDFDRWMEMDLEYIDHWSFWLDLRIMLRTIPAVITGRGAR